MLAYYLQTMSSKFALNSCLNIASKLKHFAALCFGVAGINVQLLNTNISHINEEESLRCVSVFSRQFIAEYVIERILKIGSA